MTTAGTPTPPQTPQSPRPPLYVWHVVTDELVPLRPIRADDLIAGPAWQDMLAVTLDRCVDDDEKDQVVGMIGYAWAQHGGQRHHTLEQHLITWFYDQTVVVHAPLATRTNKSRSIEQAGRDLLRSISEYVHDGSPVRKRTPGRLIDPLEPAVRVTGFSCY